MVQLFKRLARYAVPQGGWAPGRRQATQTAITTSAAATFSGSSFYHGPLRLSACAQSTRHPSHPPPPSPPPPAKATTTTANTITATATSGREAVGGHVSLLAELLRRRKEGGGGESSSQALLKSTAWRPGGGAAATVMGSSGGGPCIPPQPQPPSLIAPPRGDPSLLGLSPTTTATTTATTRTGTGKDTVRGEGKAMAKAKAGAEGEAPYVPLLFRREFMQQGWRHPHAPLPIADLPTQATATTTTTVVAPARSSVPRRGNGNYSDESHNNDDDDGDAIMVEALMERQADGGEDDDDDAISFNNTTTTTTEEQVDEYTVDDSSSGDYGSGDGSPLAGYTATPLRTTTRIVLDPVQWLAQSADAPLMEAAVLLSRIAPTAHYLTFEDRQDSRYDGGEEESIRTHRAGEESHDRDNNNMIIDTAGASITATTSADGGVDGTGAGEAEENFSLAASRIDKDSTVAAAVPAEKEKQEEEKEERSPSHRAAAAAITKNRRPTTTTTKAAGSNLSCYEDDDYRIGNTTINEAADGAENTYVAGSLDRPLPLTFSPKAATDPAADSRLIYNVFTRRVVKEGSSVVQSLALLGIHVDKATRELTLSDPDALHSFAGKLRARAVAWPSFWSHSVLYRQLESFLLSSGEGGEDPLVQVRELLAAQYARLRTRQRVGVVTAAATAGGAVAYDEHGNALPSPLPLLPDGEQQDRVPDSLIQTVDEKLFSLADLNEEQRGVVELTLQGHHTYIGGSAGTGKSVLLRVITQQLRREGLTVAVTGTTGVASTLIGGCTLHHCFGINLHGEFTRPKELAAYDAIIIDEVSMLSRDLFESLERQLRRANGVDLPFGGVQIVLCGDFLQLGAIASQPIVNAPLFRRNFTMLKLVTPVRQAESLVYAEQLRQLRRGRVPAGLEETVNFMTAPNALVAASERAAAAALAVQQQQQLSRILGESELKRISGGGEDNSNANSANGGDKEDNDATTTTTTTTATTNGTTYIEGAVNLLPTNEEVYIANERELAKLPGEATVFAPQILAPGLNGQWSPTYLLRILHPSKLQSRRLAMEIELFIGAYFKGTELGAAWLVGSLDQKHIVMYPLFVDALALRVRLPIDITDHGAQAFLAHIGTKLDAFLEGIDLGVRVREVLPHSEGLQTEQDEYILDQYAQHSPMARPLTLKLGARVMLRANLAPGLVNGSLGTVVGFRRLTLDDLPRYLTGNAQREEAIQSYIDFLVYEQGFAAALVPEIDFGGGRVEAIPPTVFFVGGLPNTHHYSTGIVALPLSLAYAFTVHKVQGLTLVGRVHLELSRMWPCEHLLYVAMSRVKNPEQLSISNFHSGLVKAAADCLVYDDALPTVTGVRLLPHFLPATWRRAPQRRKKQLRRRELEKLAARKRQGAKEAAEGRRVRLAEEIRALQEKMLTEGSPAAAAPS